MTGKGQGAILVVGGFVGVGLLAALARPASASTSLPARKPAPSGGGGKGPRPVDKIQKLARLEPTTRDLYGKLEEELAKQGIKLLTGRTISTIAEEKQHAANGKSAIKSGVSWHVLGRAIDAYPIDPKTGQPDMNGRNVALYRAMHRIWARLGGFGLAFKPYPEGPVRKLMTPDGRAFYDLGHLEYHGPHATIAAAYAAEKDRVSAYA